MNPIEEISITAGTKAKYDANAKLLVSDKSVLARILKYVIPEYRNMAYNEIAECIERDCEIGTSPVSPFLDASTPMISGDNVEDSTATSGVIRFDVVFKTKVTKEKEPSSHVVDVEIQNSLSTKYSFLQRAVFYCGRLLSRQYGSVFSQSDYQLVQPIYSIWLFPSATPQFIGHDKFFRLVEVPAYNAEPRLVNSCESSLINIAFIYFNQQAEDLTGVNRFLQLLFSGKRNKAELLENEFAFSMSKSTKEVSDEMCNLSIEIEKRGVEIGINNSIIKLLSKNFSVSEVAEMLDVPVELVQKLKDSMEN